MRGSVCLYLALLYVTCEAKDASKWYELNTPPDPNLTSITLTEDSVLNLVLNDRFINGVDHFEGNVNLDEHSLIINTNIIGVTGISQTTIYQNTSATPISISGGGLLTLNIGQVGGGTVRAKSLFNVDNGGVINLEVPTTITIIPNYILFSIFRAGEGSINITNSLNIDVSQAIGTLEGSHKAIFDINSAGKIKVNEAEQNCDVILKGDIFSNGGTLIANLMTSNSSFDGRILLKDSSVTKLKFANWATGKAEIKVQDTSSLSLALVEHVRFDGTLTLQGQSSFILNNSTSEFYVDATFGGESTSDSDIVGGDWVGDITLQGALAQKDTFSHTINLSGSSMYDGNIEMQSNTNLSLTLSNSRIKGSLNALESNKISIVLDDRSSPQAQEKFNITANNSDLLFQSRNTSQYLGDMTLSGTTQAQISFDTQSEANTIITLSDTSSLLFALDLSSEVAGEIQSYDSSRSEISINGGAIFRGDAIFGGVSTSQSTMDNEGEWRGNITINSPTPPPHWL